MLITPPFKGAAERENGTLKQKLIKCCEIASLIPGEKLFSVTVAPTQMLKKLINTTKIIYTVFIFMQGKAGLFVEHNKYTRQFKVLYRYRKS